LISTLHDSLNLSEKTDDLIFAILGSWLYQILP